jgi:uncharacterized damage-inducible protein DinB
MSTLNRLDEGALQLRAGPGQWAIWQIASHIAGARAHWMCGILQEGDPALRAIFRVQAGVASAYAADPGWEHDEGHPRSRQELTDALERTWEMVDSCIGAWSADMTGSAPPGLKYGRTRGWVAWHLAEHDVHHGGAISLTLGLYGLEGLGL